MFKIKFSKYINIFNFYKFIMNLTILNENLKSNNFYAPFKINVRKLRNSILETIKLFIKKLIKETKIEFHNITIHIII